MPQYTNDYSSSLSYLYADSQQVFASEPSASQTTISAPEQQASPVPPSLQFAETGRKKGWVLYTALTKDDFVNWWLETHFGQKKKLRWDGNRQSGVWKDFEQVAHHHTGLPKVMCQRCGNLIEHPNYSINGKANGTSSMRRHFTGDQCQKSTEKVIKQPGIKQAFQEAASSGL
ncbi:hypothetical protein CNMCM5793_003543 [Aspergillus hiratsukae]|uniref:BED-type domain-containing protein n=1 Tax=Aspergillus hiratsukae TaxID=1194566 RepID=A0A8H6PEA4_9EURO|nr:hypothetical protein CNMCM5793_003543 [Aspergillus hiratsukae]